VPVLLARFKSFAVVVEPLSSSSIVIGTVLILVLVLELDDVDADGDADAGAAGFSVDVTLLAFGGNTFARKLFIPAIAS
jgi:hypothetical protein